MVTGRVTQRYRERVSEITNREGRMVETGIYVAVSAEAIRRLEGCAPWPMILYLPEEIIERVAAEVVAAADRFLAADVGPQVLPYGMAASTLAERGVRGYRVDPKGHDAYVGGGAVAPLMRGGADEVLALLEVEPGLSKVEVGDRFGVTDRTIRNWFERAGIPGPGPHRCQRIGDVCVRPRGWQYQLSRLCPR